MALVDTLQTAVDGWATALSNDSANPQPSYSLDGKQVSRTEWRESLLKMILDTNKTINALNPYIISTKHVL